MKLSFQNIFFVIATFFALFAILVLAKPILIPLSFGLLLSFILFPVAKKLESWKMSKPLAAFLAIFLVLLIIGGITFFFSTQLIALSKEFTNFQDRIILAFANITLYINDNVKFIADLEKNELFDRMKNWLNESTGLLVTKSINNTATFLTGLVATIIFTFLFLIYRTGFTEAFIAFFPKTEKERVLKMFKSIQRVGQSYFLGMLILIILIGFGNSFGLLIIGLDNPFLFGFLGATMSIVPYIGTVVGAIIPISYSFATNESALTALAIAILFWAVQMITDNFLTPKIVGGSVKINALAAILSLIVGASVWGVAGMILFLPFLAMLKVVCQEYETLEPLALLIGDQHQDKDGSESLISKGFKKLKNRISNRHHSIKK